ncbi:MAG: DUF402 domain-containing protein [Lachnospiraceae bacterium]|nr:DUF402 domain-containing protein [Lachnospiraceae bacterium]
MVLDGLKIYRRRYIPKEYIDLKNDERVSLDDNYLITKWKPLRPRSDFAAGVSVYCLKDGWKISNIMDEEGNTLEWYCDICEFIIDDENNTFTSNDLLLDVIVYPDGRELILDADEAAEALEKGMITKEQMIKALRSFNSLLEVLRHGEFENLVKRLNL